MNAQQNAVGRVDAEGRVTWYDPIPEGGALLYARPTGFPECSGCPSSCPENEGYGCCGKAQAAPGAAAAAPEWMACATRAPWVANSLRSRAHELRAAEKRSRSAFNKDFMGVPAQYFADALADAAAAVEARLQQIEAARAAQAQGGPAHG